MIAPSLIHSDKTGFSDNLESQVTLDETHQQVALEMVVQVGETCPVDAGKIPCRKGIELLNKLKAAMTQIPNNIPLATPAHQLSVFSANPQSCVTSLGQGVEMDLEDDWVMFNSMLKTAFGWGESEMQENVKEMGNRGEHGLDGFIRFFKYFVLQRGLEGMLIEPKFDGLLHEINNR